MVAFEYDSEDWLKLPSNSGLGVRSGFGSDLNFFKLLKNSRISTLSLLLPFKNREFTRATRPSRP